MHISSRIIDDDQNFLICLYSNVSHLHLYEMYCTYSIIQDVSASPYGMQCCQNINSEVWRRHCHFLNHSAEFQLHLIFILIKCEPKNPPLGFLTFFDKRLRIFSQFLHTYRKVQSTLDYKILFNYL